MTIEIYVSTDIEADGSIPEPHSLLSIASAAYTADKQLVATFTANLETLPGAQGHPKTMSWWSEQPDAWAACRANPHPPAQVMQTYHSWLVALPGKPIFVAYPAAFDFMFVYWYPSSVTLRKHLPFLNEESFCIRSDCLRHQQS